jgi:hypothetical protein
MDPLSITAGAGALARLAFSITKAISSGIDEARNVDSKLQEFAKEISALAEVLNMIENAFQNSQLSTMKTNPEAGRDHVSKILHGLRRILRDCKDILDKLKTLIDEAKNKSSRLPVLRRSKAAMELKFKALDIAFIRTQIQSYNSVMQMTLCMLNV